MSQDPRFAPTAADATGHLPRSIYAVPMDTGQDIVGSLEVLEPSAELAALAVKTGEAFDHLGQVLFLGAAAAVDDAGVAAALRDS